MDKKESQSKLTKKLADLKINQEKELYRELANEYSEELIDKESIWVLKQGESEEVYTKLSNFIPFDFSGSGRIIWSQMKETHYVKNADELSILIKHYKYGGSQVYLLRKFSITKTTPLSLRHLLKML
ncbi:hypothetical protein [Neobacillus sp. OS1-33]|uniref:hypothetical protein n=1 Tax=Neobacillus sp. OS1-33 TaxID=3070683 RepID=UPI0027DFCAC3|nr:hypothetical protein [Neobacillus sp. OS1-33]WML26890.1 hypothetical protein RCG22_04445 [Neobacillus sp. OS1-33]